MNYKEIYDKEYERVKNAMADDLYKGVQNAKSTEESYNSFSNDSSRKYYINSKEIKESLTVSELKVYLKIIEERIRYEKNKLNNVIQYKITPFLSENDLENKIDLVYIIKKLAQVESTDYYINSFRNDYNIYTLLFEFNKLDQFLDIYYDRIDKDALETELMDLKYPNRNKTWEQPLSLSLSTDQAQTPEKAVDDTDSENEYSVIFSNDEKYIMLNLLYNSYVKDIKDANKTDDLISETVKQSNFIRLIALCGNIEYNKSLIIDSSSNSKDYNRFSKGLFYSDKQGNKQNETLMKLIQKLEKISTTNFKQVIELLKNQITY